MCREPSDNLAEKIVIRHAGNAGMLEEEPTSLIAGNSLKIFMDASGTKFKIVRSEGEQRANGVLLRDREAENNRRNEMLRDSWP